MDDDYCFDDDFYVHEDEYDYNDDDDNDDDEEDYHSFSTFSHVNKVTDKCYGHDNNEKITLYHYTTISGGMGIEMDGKINKSTMATPYCRRRHGLGVYFTSLAPSHNSRALVVNNFIRPGERLRDQNGALFRKIRYVVRVTFPRHKVEKITDGQRDLYVYRDDVLLHNYDHSVGPNPYYP